MQSIATLHIGKVPTFSIQRLGSGSTLQLIGKMTVTALGEVRRAIDLVAQNEQHVTLDLGELTLIDKHSAEFLATQATHGVRLTGCPLYLERWITPPPQDELAGAGSRV